MLRSVRARRRLVPALAATVLFTLIGPAGPMAPAGAAVPSTPLVTTIAGNGAGSDTTGTGEVATGKTFGDVWAVGDMDGTILTTDRTSCRLRLIDRAGLAHDLAGTGTCGYSDGGALSSALDSPTGVAATGATVYVADTANCLVRRYDFVTNASGVIQYGSGTLTRVAGTAPVGGVAQCGSTGDGGAATSGRLNLPVGLDLDAAGNLYIAESGGCRIRKLTAATGVLSTVAGSGTCGHLDGAAATARFNQPRGVAVDDAGAVYVADTGNHRIRRVSGGTVSTIAGTGTAGTTGNGGAATSALLSSPNGVAVDVAGKVFVADTGSCRVRAFTVGGTISSVVGTGTCGDGGTAGLPGSTAVGALDNVSVSPGGDVIISDASANKVRIVDGLAANGALGSTHTGLVEDWRRYGNSNHGDNWTAGDGVRSIALPDGRILWTYADSYIDSANAGDHVKPDHSRGDRFFINNQVVIQTPNGSGPPTFENVLPNGARTNYFTDIDADHDFWPATTFYKDEGTIAVLLSNWQHTAPQSVEGLYLSEIPVDDLDAPTTPVEITGLTPAGTPNSGCSKVSFGDSVVVQNGFSYIYGNETCGASFHLRVARLRGSDLTAGTGTTGANPWRYWNGSSWSTTGAYDPNGRLEGPGGTDVDDAGNELSVIRTGGGLRFSTMFLDTTTLTITMRRRTAAAPQGPWTASEQVYTVPDPYYPAYNSEPECWMWPYNGKEQAPFADGDEMVMTYNMGLLDINGNNTEECDNGFFWGALNANVDLYRPRYVRVRVEPPSAPTGVGATRIAGDGSATIRWTTPADDGGAWPSEYTISAYSGATLVTTATIPAPNPADGDPWGTVTGLTNGTAYTFKVSATNEAGTGPQSSASSSVTPARCKPYASCSAAVTDIFQAMARRNPTTTEASTNTTALTTGTSSMEALISSLRTSTDQTTRVDPLIRLYVGYYRRLPDGTGFRYWHDQMLGGTTLATISQSFSTTPEFTTLYGSLSNQQFVELVYENVLDREGSTGDVAYWVNQLDTGTTRGAVMLSFTESSENKTQDAAQVREAALWLVLQGRPPVTSELDTTASATTHAGRLVRRIDYPLTHPIPV